MKTKTQNSQKSNTAVFLAAFMNLYTLSLLLATLAPLHVFVSVNFEINFKKRLYNEPYLSILVGKMEH